MPDEEGSFLSYSLFAKEPDCGLCCAVRQDQPLPGFVEGWSYAGTIADMREAPPDFRPRAAQAATSLTGYYLFLSLRPRRGAGGTPAEA
ncbi:hypothetical protein [Methylobacterium oxalidis]|uniref:Uncharacterized protein n=1 Tax=Methylobacterium oxalidis TaxID=944322 RepID=A0A512J1R7_9HYPH|nr:hypothetical protein [Methylobacterium oxalidis]GEP03867.1 hypothetical protein MOX02_19050 [Methylobacterium oxalidis]GJE31258.1 hypothetical protein LDDCCGHA_1434 [Methylobacterium oxalidis]GLS65275.1 hypothetical protein GCM10007888_36570 [Methylobacterium oxalidis]